MPDEVVIVGTSPQRVARWRLCFALFYCVCDISVNALLFAHIHYFNQKLSENLKFYSFSSATLEFLLFSAARSCMLIGCVIAFLYNPIDTSRRIRHCSPAALLLSAAASIFFIIKLLAHAELSSDSDPSNSSSDAWYWAQFACSEAGALGFYVCVVLLGGAGNGEVLGNRTAREEVTINSSVEERQSLLGETRTSSSGEDGNGEDLKETAGSSKTSSVFRLIKYSRPDADILSIAFLFMILASVAEIFTPWYTGQVIQEIVIARSYDGFVRAIIWMSVFAGGSSIATGIRGGFFKVAMARLNIRIRNHLFASIVRQEVDFFDVTKTGDMTSRLTSDTTTMSDALALNVNIFLRSLIKTVGVCVFMFKLSWKLSMVTVIGLPVIMAVSKLYGIYYEALSKKVQDSLARANEVAEEVCSSIRTVRSFATELEETKRYADRLNVTYRLKFRESFAYAGYMWSTQLFSLSLVIATLIYGAHLVITNMLVGGDLVSFILYQMELGYALESIADVYTGLMAAIGASAKVFEYIDRSPKVPTDGTLAPQSLHGSLEFRNVSFSYPSRPSSTVLKNVSFRVEPGEVVALVGPSGGGKTSCVNLIEHFYEPLSGEVLLDGVPVNRYNHSYLHRQISLVGQEPVLYARSVRDNIAYGLDPDDQCLSLDCIPQPLDSILVSESLEERVKKAAQLANAHTFISEMRDGYETEVGEKGACLSGGQKQRVAIARALIRQPVVLLLDEATSALDSESEHAVQRAIYGDDESACPLLPNRTSTINSIGNGIHQPSGGAENSAALQRKPRTRCARTHTVLIIAHRLSTVERADRVIVISHGEVVEQGTHMDLVNTPGGLYAKLVQRQMLGTEIGVDVDEEMVRSGSVGAGTTGARTVSISKSDALVETKSPSFTPPKFGTPPRTSYGSIT